MKYQTYNPNFSSKSSYMYTGSRTMVSMLQKCICTYQGNIITDPLLVSHWLIQDSACVVFHTRLS